jgi:hypothetical protein
MIYLAIAAFGLMYFRAFLDKKAAIFYYFLFLPFNGIISKDFTFLPFTYPLMFSIIVLYHFLRIKPIAAVSKSSKNLYVDLALKVMLVLVLYLVYSEFKHSYYKFLTDDTLLSAFKRSLSIIGKWLPLYFIIKEYHHNEMIFNLFKKAAFISGIIVLVSMPCSGILHAMDFDVRFNREGETDIENISTTERNVGFYGGGDSNSAGVFFNLLIGICFLELLKTKKLRRSYLTLIFIFTLGIALTGSRMAFITMVLLFSFFGFRTTLSLNKIILGMSLVVLLVILIDKTDVFNVIFERFEKYGTEEQYNLTLGGNRTIRWLLFIKYGFEDSARFFFGYNSLLFSISMQKYYDPHNVFIRMFYYSGILFLIPFLYYLGKYVYHIIKEKDWPFSTFYFLPMAISFMIISQLGPIYHLLFLIANASLWNKNGRC